MLMPNYYPSSRNISKYIWYTNILFIISGLIQISYNFWMYTFNGFYSPNTSSKDVIEIGLFTFISAGLCFFGTFLILYLVWYLSSFVVSLFKQIIFNYINELPLFSNTTIIKYTDNNCWICNKYLGKNKILKKLNCPCQEYFHPECIDKYLGMYNNYCKAGHKISKYEHTV
jgi:hypothetical protein